MKSRILYLFTRTPLHVGAGSSVGVVDQPIQRERHTGYPIIPGSSIKGVMRDQLQANPQFSDDGVDLIFGRAADAARYGEGDSGAGGIVSFTEARLLAFPLRSAKGSYALATCPLALARYGRDLGVDYPIPDVADNECCAGPTVAIDNKAVVLEEYCFEVQDAFPAKWAEHLSHCLNDAVMQGAESRFVLLSDGDFAHFAMNATQVSQHVRISDETGTVDGSGLFNEETVPSETLFYSSLVGAPRSATKEQEEQHTDAIGSVFSALGEEQLIQFGGNNTTGLGYCTACLARVNEQQKEG